MRFLKNWIWLLIAITNQLNASPNYLPENHAVNGGLTVIPVDINQRPSVFYNKQKLAVIPSTKTNQWLLLVGIPLDKPQPIQTLNMIAPYKGTIPFHVSEKFYATQYLTIADKSKVEPSAEDQKRIDRENKEMAQIFKGYTPILPFTETYQAPAHGPVSSLFGLKRVFNKQPRPPHLGLDVAAPENSPVLVIAKGKVVAVRDYFFTGNTVIVDHGMGVFSLYAHLNQTKVREGQQLKQGTSVGTIGKTGRATGPHLHWSMIVNQNWVDPLLFVPYRIVTAVPAKANKQNQNKAGAS